jgi:hypothetical protein
MSNIQVTCESLAKKRQLRLKLAGAKMEEPLAKAACFHQWMDKTLTK